MQDLARMSLVKSANKNSVDYNDLANIVDQQETLQFLQGILCVVTWLIISLLLSTVHSFSYFLHLVLSCFYLHHLVVLVHYRNIIFAYSSNADIVFNGL